MKKEKQKSKIFHFIFRSFLFLILAILIFIGIILVLYLGDTLLNTNKENRKPLFSTFVILTPSMVPTINVDDAIIVKRLDNDNYKVGDIITFYSNDVNYQGLAVTHRIIKKKKINNKESIYNTKGDSNRIKDPTPVKTDEIYGKVILRIPKIGYIKRYFNNPKNCLILFIIPAAIIIIYNFGKIVYLMKKKRKKEI